MSIPRAGGRWQWSLDSSTLSIVLRHAELVSASMDVLCL